MALHLLVLSFFVSIPPAKYFFATCMGTVVVWGLVFSLKEQQRKVGIAVGLLLALVIQQLAFQIWRSELAGIWWPLLQFFSLQYVVILSLSRSSG
jgi:hypothetical protein